MSTKTITLAGSEIKAEFSGANAWLRNDGADVIYAAANPGITAGADGVVAILAGQSAPVYGANGAVWLTGTGSVQLIGSDYSTNPFKTSAQAGGSGADNVARAAINAHSGNTEIHVTADEKAAWSAVNYSNPNLLINPDFAINQRGETEYTTTGYTVDRWSMQVGFKITPLENGIRICPTEEVTSNKFSLYQHIPVSKAMFGSDYTLTVNVSATNDYAYAVVYAYNSANAVIKSSDKIKLNTGLNSTTIRNIPDNTAYIRVQFTINSGAQTSDTLEILWAKLELGGIATPYTPPDPATELAKCQRYYQIRSTNDIDPVDLRPSMGNITDIKQVTGGYAYVAE